MQKFRTKSKRTSKVIHEYCPNYFACVETRQHCFGEKGIALKFYHWQRNPRMPLNGSICLHARPFRSHSARPSSRLDPIFGHKSGTHCSSMTLVYLWPCKKNKMQVIMMCLYFLTHLNINDNLVSEICRMLKKLHFCKRDGRAKVVSKSSESFNLRLDL